jgi:glutathione S-transferase
VTDGYTAVIFTNQHSGIDPDGYEQAATRMAELAAQQPGYREIESVRGADGVGITVSYWDSDADARAWKQHAEHAAIQHTGRDRWYSWYRLRVATVEREYTFDATSTTILHIALPSDWQQAQQDGEYRVSTRGLSLEQQGFIHCSYPHQLEGVANRFYGDLSELLLLQIDVDLLDAELKVEPPTDGIDELFPHVYGPIPTAAVVATTPWHRDNGDPWQRPANA